MIKATTISIRLFRNIYYYIYIYIKKKKERKKVHQKRSKEKKNRSIDQGAKKLYNDEIRKRQDLEMRSNYAVAFNNMLLIKYTVLCQHFFRIFFFSSPPFFFSLSLISVGGDGRHAYV